MYHRFVGTLAPSRNFNHESPNSASDKLSGMPIRCFAYRNKSGEFEAECIDLNLFVKAKSMNKAVRSLRDAISGYLAVALDGDSEGLVPRPSPFARRLAYYWLVFELSLNKSLSASGVKKRFDFHSCHSLC